MKKIAAISVSILLGTSLSSFTPNQIKDKESIHKAVVLKGSPRKDAEGKIDGVSIKVDYGSPSVKGRKIWGGLEAYGKLWRAGANETTSMEFDKDVLINGKELKAGKYGFFIIPNENEDWVVVFNKEWSKEEHNSWGAYNYHKEKEVLRVNIKVNWSKTNQEELMYSVDKKAIKFAWEKASLTMKVKAK